MPGVSSSMIGPPPLDAVGLAVIPAGSVTLSDRHYLAERTPDPPICRLLDWVSCRAVSAQIRMIWPQNG